MYQASIIPQRANERIGSGSGYSLAADSFAKPLSPGTRWLVYKEEYNGFEKVFWDIFRRKMSIVRVIGIYKVCDVVIESVSALALKNALYVIMFMREAKVFHKIKVTYSGSVSTYVLYKTKF